MSDPVSGDFVTLHGERYYVIRNVDGMPPFLVSLVSSSDHWMFVASNGGLTAGRVSPETALFPYVTVDKLYDSTLDTGSRTLVRVEREGASSEWQPFNRQHDDRYRLTRNLYKSVLGDKLLFEEVNHDLNLVFRYRWVSSDTFGFARQCELENRGEQQCRLHLLDGLLNILPAGTPRHTQTISSYLVDAYKWSELDEETGLALFTLYSGITDRAEPCESLRASTVFCLGLEKRRVLLSSQQLEAFRGGSPVSQEELVRGMRGAYLVNASLQLEPGVTERWQLVAGLEQSQCDVVDLKQRLSDPVAVAQALEASIDEGSDRLARTMASGDGFQQTAEEQVSVHHYANVLFNILRGGVFDHHYGVSGDRFRDHVRWFNRSLYTRHQSFLDALPDRIDGAHLLSLLADRKDPQLQRLGYEYLPVRFGRRHGDPSRPWNQFAINLTDAQGEPLLCYQGNWRDIFQNWETLLISFPEFAESVIAKFINASTVDGYNPYRIGDDGIDWEVEDPEDPWSYIGYWGDHQIIYLLKLLELSAQFHPGRLNTLLREPLFGYANVPYRIKPFEAILENPSDTVLFDSDAARRIDERVLELGADGKLLPGADGQVYQVNLLEKLLVPLLSKLGNLVIDGGIWLNTQRPEWNDANNALVGQGLSMVTLYYLRRYVRFISRLLVGESGSIELSREVALWLDATASSLGEMRQVIEEGVVGATERHRFLVELGAASSAYRQSIYEQGAFSGTTSIEPANLLSLLEDALAVIDHSIRRNLRDDGLFHAYNLLGVGDGGVEVDHLYPMLEGQVAALSSGFLDGTAAAELVEQLFQSDIYRADQNTFLLYPDRSLPRFLQKNVVPAEGVLGVPLLVRMLDESDHRIVACDVRGDYRFHPDLVNAQALRSALEGLVADYGDVVESSRASVLSLYESVFDHRSFTGRSGGMFGFEGLGSIYWHMVSKLLLAVQENFFSALDQDEGEAVCTRLGRLYYRVREGIGFNKSPQEYGAFPTDPYSHTPGHMGAQQPGMTGQVKEEVITRFGELGVRVRDGVVHFMPALLRPREFLREPGVFRFLAVSGEWEELSVPSGGLAFTWCQVPLVYRLGGEEPSLEIIRDDGSRESMSDLALPADLSRELFQRTGRIQRIELDFPEQLLLTEQT